MRGGQCLDRGPDALPGQLQPVQRRDRRHHVGGIGALLPAGLDQPVCLQPLQQRVQCDPLQPGLRDLRPEFRQDRVVERAGRQRQAEEVLPVQRPLRLLGSLPVGQVLRLLQHRDQRQHRRGIPRAAPYPERRREVLILQPLAQPVPDRHRHRRLALPGPDRPDRRRDLRVRLRPRDRLHRHDMPILQPERGEAAAAARS